MSTARKIINRAASYIGVKREGSPLTDEEYTDSLDTLNDFIYELQSRNVKFQITAVENVDDDIEEFDWTSSFIKSQLALRLAPEFSVQVPPDFHAFARTASSSVLRRMHELENVYKPPILPTGTGNSGIFDDHAFYNDPTKEDLETASGAQIEDELADNILRGV